MQINRVAPQTKKGNCDIKKHILFFINFHNDLDLFYYLLVLFQSKQMS